MPKRTGTCPVCAASWQLKEPEPDHAACPRCGTDLLGGAETRVLVTECDYAKSTFQSDVGVLILTDRRLFWVKGRLTVVAGNLAAYAVASALSNRGADKIGLEVPLSEIDSVRETKKGLVGKTFTVFTKDGKKHQFQPSKEDLETWKGALAPYIQR